MQPYRRGKYLVNKSLQWKLMAFSIGYVVLFFLVVSLALFIPLVLDLAYADTSSSEALQVATLLLHLHNYFWPAAFLTFVIIFFHSLRLSHKIAGPLYRFNVIFTALHNGILAKPTRLRSGDYLMPYMDTLNDALRTLREHIGTIQTAQRQLNTAIHDCIQMAPHAAHHELLHSLKHVAEKERALADKLASFSIEP